MHKTPSCPLCELANPDRLTVPEPTYYHCRRCDLRFLDPVARLQPEDERKRYLNHENVASNRGYVQFLEPLFHSLRPRLTEGAHGLDFGCGPNSVMREIFVGGGFKMDVYDPFFAADATKLERQYDFITATEVVEHLFNPAQEFLRLHHLLKPGGYLGLMTLLVTDRIDFSSWYYRRDPTHVVFYTKRTFGWIAEQFGFENVYCDEQRVVTLRRRS